jgi:hypothetical protein
MDRRVVAQLFDSIDAIKNPPRTEEDNFGDNLADNERTAMDTENNDNVVNGSISNVYYLIHYIADSCLSSLRNRCN